MTKKISSVIGIAVFAAFILGFGLTCFLKEPVDILESERRKAAQFPELTLEGVMDKSYFNSLEDYLADQFPLRDSLRSVKATIQLKLLGQKDNNKIYFVDGHISELSGKLNEDSVEKVAQKLNDVYTQHLANKNTNCYFTVVPDKNYFLAEKNGYPSLDYDKMIEIYTSGVENMKYIDIFGSLEIDDYYKTDSHWKQQNLDKVVAKLADEMNFTAKPSNLYTAEKITDFKGVYSPRLAMGNISDEIICLTSSATQKSTVYNLEKNKTTTGVYDMTKLSSGDKYDIYLSGAAALLTVENPLATEKRELVVFRDSFGSSLAPLMLESYSKITLVDLRYISSQVIGEFVDFENCDVLFIYNTQILNQSSMLK